MLAHLKIMVTWTMGFLYSLIRIEHLAWTMNMHENIHEPIFIRILYKWYTRYVLIGITFNGKGFIKYGIVWELGQKLEDDDMMAGPKASKMRTCPLFTNCPTETILALDHLHFSGLIAFLLLYSASSNSNTSSISVKDTFWKKHRKNCECCPGHYLIVNHYSSI